MKITEMKFTWLPQGPVLSGYGYGFSREAGLIERGEKKVVQYASRDETKELTPSFLATAAKGVFRSAAAWIVEREGQVQHQGNDSERVYITSEYIHARPEKGGWTKAIGALNHRDERDFGLDPVARIFGDTGGIPQKSSNSMRRQGLVRFSFDTGALKDSDALFGTVRPGGRQTFAWEEASDRKPNPLLTEKFTPVDPARLVVRLQSGEHRRSEEDYKLGIALICLSADMISTGFFRFGRFTSRGYGWVRLSDPDAVSHSLLDKVSGKAGMSASGGSGMALGQELLGESPWDIVRDQVAEWING